MPHLCLEPAHVLEDLTVLPSLGQLGAQTFEDDCLVDVLVRRVCGHPTVERWGSVFNKTLKTYSYYIYKF